MDRLFLIGYRGVGKTTVARLLAQKLGWTWTDADALLEERAGQSIRDIFTAEGEAGFRDRESALLAELGEKRNHVLATGGGVVLREGNRRLLENGAGVWLQAAPAAIWQRLQADSSTTLRRPDLAQGGLAEIESLLALRQPWYASCAQWAVATDRRAPAEIAEEILALVRE